MTEEKNKLVEEIGNCGFYADPDGTTFRIIPAKLSEQIIAALRREPDPVLGECEECGHTIVTPLKRLPEREPATDAVLEMIENLVQARVGGLALPAYETGWNNALYSLKKALKGKGASQGASPPQDVEVPTSSPHWNSRRPSELTPLKAPEPSENDVAPRLVPPRDKEWDHWWALNHPWDWWAKERSGEPLPTFDRLLVAQFARTVWDAAKVAQRKPSGR